jgi:HEAT repeat protein
MMTRLIRPVRGATVVSAVWALTLLLPAGAHAQLFLNKSAQDWAKGLNDGQPAVRRGAAFALGKLGAASEGYLLELARRAQKRDEDPRVREMAARSIGDILLALPNGSGPIYWPEAGQPLSALLAGETDERVRAGVAYALGAFGPAASPAAEALQALVADKSPMVRQNVAWALGQLGKSAPAGAVTALRQLLRDGESLVRRDTATALGEIGLPAATPAVNALIDMVNSENARGDQADQVVIKTGLEKLVALVTPENKAAAAQLTQLTRHEDPETALYAALALSKMGGEEARVALDALRKALKSSDSKTQELAAAALAQMGKDAAPAVLELADALKASGPNVRRNAAVALTHMGELAAPALPRLIQALDAGQEPNPEVRLYVAEAISRIGHPANEPAIPAILRAIQNTKEEPRVRHRCVWTLLHRAELDMARYGADKVLLAVLDETEPRGLLIRYDSARTLARHMRESAPFKAATTLKHMMENKELKIYEGTGANAQAGNESTGSRSGVKEQLGGDARFLGAEALGWMGQAANQKEIVKALQLAKQDKDARLAKEATTALERIR